MEVGGKLGEIHGSGGKLGEIHGSGGKARRNSWKWGKARRNSWKWGKARRNSLKKMAGKPQSIGVCMTELLGNIGGDLGPTLRE